MWKYKGNFFERESNKKNDREIFWKFKTPMTVNLDVTKYNPV